MDDAHHIGREWVLQVTGAVRPRPEGTVNADLPTGEVEVGAATVVVLNQAEPPPFPLSERADDVDEVLRLRHRYLDLRRPSMQQNLRLRSAVNAALRTSMTDQDFVEVETPMLIASTPEGARDFVVPSRLSPGTFYALPQSPQLFKQLLMVGGLDRYFQIARCLRDEDLRGNRQFEFMQLDMEMSFAGQADVHGRRHHRGRARRSRPSTGAPLPDVPHHDLGRRDGALRLRQARRALRHGAHRPGRRGGGHRVQGVPRRGGQGHLRARARRRVALDARRPRRPRQGARRGRAGVDARARRRRPRVTGRQVPLRDRAGRHRRRARRRARRPRADRRG